MSIEWIAGIAISIILTLIGIIWKSMQKQSDTMQIRIDDLEGELGKAIQKNQHSEAMIEAIRENCARHHKTDMAENDIRNIFREELKEFETRIKKEITASIKLTLIEEGYITPVKSTRKRNVEKV
jgi:plasmid stability protein